MDGMRIGPEPLKEYGRNKAGMKSVGEARPYGLRLAAAALAVVFGKDKIAWPLIQSHLHRSLRQVINVQSPSHVLIVSL